MHKEAYGIVKQTEKSQMQNIEGELEGAYDGRPSSLPSFAFIWKGQNGMWRQACRTRRCWNAQRWRNGCAQYILASIFLSGERGWSNTLFLQFIIIRPGHPSISSNGGYSKKKILKMSQSVWYHMPGYCSDQAWVPVHGELQAGRYLPVSTTNN